MENVRDEEGSYWWSISTSPQKFAMSILANLFFSKKTNYIPPIWKQENQMQFFKQSYLWLIPKSTKWLFIRSLKNYSNFKKFKFVFIDIWNRKLGDTYYQGRAISRVGMMVDIKKQNWLIELCVYMPADYLK